MVTDGTQTIACMSLVRSGIVTVLWSRLRTPRAYQRERHLCLTVLVHRLLGAIHRFAKQVTTFLALRVDATPVCRID